MTYHHPEHLPVGAVVVVAVTDIKLTVGAQDAQRAIHITQTPASIDITVAAHHRQTVRILLIGRQGRTRANHNVDANSISLGVTEEEALTWQSPNKDNAYQKCKYHRTDKSFFSMYVRVGILDLSVQLHLLE